MATKTTNTSFPISFERPKIVSPSYKLRWAFIRRKLTARSCGYLQSKRRSRTGFCEMTSTVVPRHGRALRAALRLLRRGRVRRGTDCGAGRVHDHTRVVNNGMKALGA